MGIIDPAYTLVLVAALVYGARRRSRVPRGRVVAAIALALSTGYLGFGYVINERAEERVHAQLAREGASVRSVRCYPTLFQLALRRVVVRGADGTWRVGWLSMWAPRDVRWRRYTPPDSALTAQLAASPRG